MTAQNSLPTADDVKVSVLEWAVAHLSADEVIASELYFLDGKRRADLAISSQNRLTAIEIKGPRDNLRKLSEQISDYLEMFLDVYVATPTDFIKPVISSVPRGVGIIEVLPRSVRLRRSSSGRSLLNKKPAANWLYKKDLDAIRKTIGLPQGADLNLMRERAASTLSRRELHTLALSSIKRRTIMRHASFISELGRTVTLDDVHMLTLPLRVKPR